MIGLLGVVMGCGGGVWTLVVLGCYLVVVVGQWFGDFLVVRGFVCETLRNKYSYTQQQ